MQPLLAIFSLEFSEFVVIVRRISFIRYELRAFFSLPFLKRFSEFPKLIFVVGWFSASGYRGILEGHFAV
jgi:hypothetical protein